MDIKTQDKIKNSEFFHNINMLWSIIDGMETYISEIRDETQELYLKNKLIPENFILDVIDNIKKDVSILNTYLMFSPMNNLIKVFLKEDNISTDDVNIHNQKIELEKVQCFDELAKLYIKQTNIDGQLWCGCREEDCAKHNTESCYNCLLNYLKNNE